MGSSPPVDGCAARAKKRPERLLVPRYGFATAAPEPPFWHGQRQRVGAGELVIDHSQGQRTCAEMEFGAWPGSARTPWRTSS